MTYKIVTFGCQMNHNDSERIAAVLDSMGYKKTLDIKKANLVVVTMCSIRQSAVDRVYGLANKLKNRKIKTILTGCILKRDKKNLSERYDLILDIKNLAKWPRILNSKKRAIRAKDYFKIQPKYSRYFSVSIPISTGCNNHCTYCVVPHTRGRELLRPVKEITDEAKNAISLGCKEIWLLGQNVNSYPKFPALLEKIGALQGDFWIKFTSSNPKDFSKELIDVMAKGEKIAEYLNLPIQSGDNNILKKMNRLYTVSRYKSIVKDIREKIPNIALSTDIIVGFPGETKEQFKNTIKLFKKIKFDMAYISQYSIRPETAALNLRDTVSHLEKVRRDKALTKILRRTALGNNKKYIGKKVKVLIEKQASPTLWFGKTRTHKTVKVQSEKQILGTFVDVKVTKALPWRLEGRLVEKKLIVILGPTASGKTALSIKLAEEFHGEIISADSRQVYEGMDIGTGKVTKKEMHGIRHHLLDVASPKRRFTVAKYRKMAEKAIDDVYKEAKLPFLVGGTAFYIQSIVDQINIPAVKPDWKFRKKLEKETSEELFCRLKKKDPRRAKSIDKKNKRRLVRALEIISKTKKQIPEFKTNPSNKEILILGIKKTNKNLDALIKKRLTKRLKQGMIAEVKKLRSSGVSWRKLEEFGLEYRYIAYYLQKKMSKDQMAEKLQKEIEHYAKRQMTWFKRDKRIYWVKDYREAKNLTIDFLSK